MTTSINVVVVRGVLSSDPRARDLPSGDRLLNYDVTTETTEGRTSVPVVSFSPKRPPAVHAGDEVVVVGTIRRRFFRAGGGAASRTEVVADLVARPTSRSMRRALERLARVANDPELVA